MRTDVPEGWRLRRIRDFLQLDRTMIQIAPEATYTSVGVRSFGKGLFHYPPKRGTDLGKLRFFRVKPRCLFISNIKAWEGAVAVVSDADHGCVASNRFLPYFGNPGEVDITFLQYFFTVGPGLNLLQIASPGSADRNRTLSISQFESLALHLPPLPEQKKIAAILSSVDEAIQATQGVIDQTRRVKEGLLHVLFNGEDQASPGESMLDVCEWIGVGIASSTTHAYRDKGVPLLRSFNIREGHWDLSEILYISEEFDEANASKRLRAGDVLVTRTGANIGMAAIVPNRFERAQCFTTLILRPDTGKIDSKYLCYWMNSPQGKRRVEDLKAGGAQPNLNVGWIKHFEIPVPPLHEQVEAVSRLDAVDESDGRSVDQLHQLEKVKAGLLQDLLTGEVRVTP